jgi:hypothetical protein
MKMLTKPLEGAIVVSIDGNVGPHLSWSSLLSALKQHLVRASVTNLKPNTPVYFIGNDGQYQEITYSLLLKAVTSELLS